MDQDDPEKRIAELERQLAEQKRIAELERQLAEAKAAAARENPAVEQPAQFFPSQVGAGQDSVDEHARRYAETLWEGLRTGGPSASGPEIAQLREALMRAAADAGMSHAQINDALQHAHVTIKTGHSVVYPGQGGPQNFGALTGVGPQPGFPGAAAGAAAIRQARVPAAPVHTRLAEPPRRIPAAFGLAELLPFRWRYIWILFMVAIAPIALWTSTPLAFAVVAVLTLLAIYAFNFRGTSKRFALLKWGNVARVTGTRIISRGTYYSGTTYYNVRLPVAHGWRVERSWYSGPSTKTQIQYTLNGSPGELVIRGREYIDGVVLADSRDPARALCVTSFPYDLDRDESGNWIGRLRRGLKVGMAVWLLIVIAWLAAAAVIGFAAAGIGFGAYLWHTAVPPGGELTVDDMDATKTIACNDGHLTVDSISMTVTVTGHCAQLTVSGIDNHVTVDSADAIEADGINNVVIFHSGSPHITNNGGTVRQG